MITKELLYEVLNNLSKDRKFFFSEADFQHALALEMAKILKDSKLYLELPIQIDDKEIMYFDIFVRNNKDVNIGIELKYKTVNVCENK